MIIIGNSLGRAIIQDEDQKTNFFVRNYDNVGISRWASRIAFLLLRLAKYLNINEAQKTSVTEIFLVKYGTVFISTNFNCSKMVDENEDKAQSVNIFESIEFERGIITIMNVF